MDQSHERTGPSVNFQSKTAKCEEETISCLDYIYVDSIIKKLQKVVSMWVKTFTDKNDTLILLSSQVRYLPHGNRWRWCAIGQLEQCSLYILLKS